MQASIDHISFWNRNRRDWKNFNKLEKSLNFEKPHDNINTINYEDLNNDKELNVEDADDDKYRKLEVLEDYLKSLIAIIINQE